MCSQIVITPNKKIKISEYFCPFELLYRNLVILTKKAVIKNFSTQVERTGPIFPS